MEKAIRSSCEYFFFPAARRKKKEIPLFCSLVWIWHFAMFPFYSHSVLQAMAISHKYFCGRLWQRLPAWAGSSSSILRASPLQSLSVLRRVSSDFLGVNADCLRVNAALLYNKLHSLSFLHPLAQTPLSQCLPAQQHNKVFLFVWTIGG